MSKYFVKGLDNIFRVLLTIFILYIYLFLVLLDLTTSEMLVNMSSSTLEEYFPAVAIATLMRIIRDPTLSQHHTMVVQVIRTFTVFTFS